MEPSRWLDLSAEKHGFAMFAHPSHPGHPPFGFARKSYTGYLNFSWPGLEETVLEPGKPVTLRYRLLVHTGLQPDQLNQKYESYVQMKKDKYNDAE